MLNRIKAIIQRVKLAIVQDVPPELDVCESCREPSPDSPRCKSCPMRQMQLGFAAHKDFRCES